MQEHTGDELTEVRRRLRVRLRGLIEKIEVYPVGRFRMTEEHVKAMLSNLRDGIPDMTTDELQRQEEQLKAQIENKELRQFNIHFTGGSKRIILPATKQKLLLDLDRENGHVRTMYLGIDGETVTHEFKN
jgi:hypothetical protein